MPKLSALERPSPLAMHNLKTRVLEAIENLSCEVGRPVVDDNDLELSDNLSQCACDGGLHIILTVVHRHQY